MKKQIFINTGFTLTVLVMFSALTVLSSCNTAAHAHTYEDTWTYNTSNHWHAASCEHTDEKADEQAHTFGNWVITKDSTEEAAGAKERSCTVCNYKETEEIAKLEHTHKYSAEWSKNDSYHWHEVTCGHEEASDKAEHNWNEGEVTEAAGCTTAGTRTYTCKVCAAEKNETIPAAHAFGSYKSNIDATFEADGTKTRKCSVCGEVDTVTDAGSKIPSYPAGYVKVSGGTITGSSDNKCWTSEDPGVFIEGREVTLSDFIMCDHEVTKAEYKAIMNSELNTEGISADPSYSSNKPKTYVITEGEDNSKQPVENVTWFNAVYYCNLLSQKEGLECVYTIEDIVKYPATINDGGEDGTEKITINFIYSATVEADHTKNGYRLPTEAEWEYAARGGNPDADEWKYEYAGSDSIQERKPYSDCALDICSWYSNNTCSKGITTEDISSSGTEGYGPHQVALKAANALGLYDMSGNVWEWCYDWRGTINTETVTDPVGDTSGEYRIQRGGCWGSCAYGASVGIRRSRNPMDKDFTLGFRVCRTAK